MISITDWYKIPSAKLSTTYYLNRFGIWPNHNKTSVYIVSFFHPKKKLQLTTEATPEVVSLSTKILYHRQLHEFKLK